MQRSLPSLSRRRLDTGVLVCVVVVNALWLHAWFSLARLTGHYPGHPDRRPPYTHPPWDGYRVVYHGYGVQTRRCAGPHQCSAQQKPGQV